ncbi:MAG: bifunctional phosphoribosyl-AMP cyclohydrolase/phosphoribosyl-ATP diphosphatase HisIE [Halanaerobiales bacterium]|nr:bifunctional phosphoribosyl-AMP cyclohydrolase/phosphoribosyl-ATP diphosphatase HisIE [Halanaerobiales bacterium]
MNNKLKVINNNVSLKFDDRGLIPAIVQDVDTRQVLMLAYMNQVSFKRTLETGETHFYSRSRQELWHKGGTSGNIQKVEEIFYDCDRDTLLILVDPAGPACHTDNTSCFYRKMAEKQAYQEKETAQDEIIELLYQLIVDRKHQLPEGSYTTYLFEEGLDKILKKVGEETAEVIIAAKNKAKKELVYETVDLIYHLLVLLVDKKVSLKEVEEELTNRYRA